MTTTAEVATVPQKKTAYDRIAEVIRIAARPLAAHEFEEMDVLVYEEKVNGKYQLAPTTEAGTEKVRYVSGRRYVGYSESNIARRLREMVVRGLAISRLRADKNFKEYVLP